MLRNILAVIFIVILSVEAFSEERAFTVAGMSMSPELMPGDTVVVDNDSKQIMKDDLVAIEFKHSKTPIVKRVVAVEGDSVEIKNNTIFVNKKPFRDIDEKRWQSTVIQLKRYNWIVPKDNLFILGDNPQNSRDSRRLGLISTSQIKGKVVKIIKSSPQ